MLGAKFSRLVCSIVVRRIQMPTQDLAPIPISRSLTPLPWHAMPEVDEPTEKFRDVARGDGGLARPGNGPARCCGELSASGPPSGSSPGVTTAMSHRDGTTPAGSMPCLGPARWAECPRGKPDVVGRVELSGLVIEHESGYRVSNARILDLWTESFILIAT